MDFNVLAEGLRFPEGPIWCKDGSILLVEIEARCLTRISMDGTRTVVAQMGGGPNGAAIGPDGHCYICNNGGFAWHEDNEGLRPAGMPDDFSGGRIERINLSTGAVECVYDRSPGGPLIGPNDLVFDAHGGIWFTDAGKGRDREILRGGAYYAKADGSMIVEAAYPMLTANGIGLSPDGSRLYVAETQTGRLWAFDLDGPGNIVKKAFPSPHGGTLIANLGDFTLCDSLAVDADGNIWVATLMKGGIAIVSPDGSRIDHISLPDRFTTNVCFGGPDMRTAYVTLSQTGKLISFPIDRPGLTLNYNDLAL